MKSVLGLSLNMKNSKPEAETTIKKNFVLKSRIVKALWAYYMMGVVSIVAVEYAYFNTFFLLLISSSTVFNLFSFNTD